MASIAGVELLVHEEFSDVCEIANHSRRPKRILRFTSCDTVCTRCTYAQEPTVKSLMTVDIYYEFDRWINLESEMLSGTEFVDCSLIQTKDAEGKMLIQLKANHTEDICGADNFCSLACKIESVRHEFGTLSSIVRMQSGLVGGEEERSRYFIAFS